MTTPLASRRRLLQLFAGAPMLPLASSLTAAGLLTACGGGDGGGEAPAFKSVTFSSMAALGLDNPAAMATTTVGSVMSVNFADDSKLDYQLSYEPFFITGGQVPDGKGGTVLAGGYVDINHQPIMDRTLLGGERQPAPARTGPDDPGTGLASKTHPAGHSLPAWRQR